MKRWLGKGKKKGNSGSNRSPFPSPGNDTALKEGVIGNAGNVVAIPSPIQQEAGKAADTKLFVKSLSKHLQKHDALVTQLADNSMDIAELYAQYGSTINSYNQKSLESFSECLSRQAQFMILYASLLQHSHELLNSGNGDSIVSELASINSDMKESASTMKKYE